MLLALPYLYLFISANFAALRTGVADIIASYDGAKEGGIAASYLLQAVIALSAIGTGRFTGGAGTWYFFSSYFLCVCDLTFCISCVMLAQPSLLLLIASNSTAGFIVVTLFFTFFRHAGE